MNGLFLVLGGDDGAWYVQSDGAMYDTDTALNSLGARPVFYLTSDTKITTDGTGSLDNPFILE